MDKGENSYGVFLGTVSPLVLDIAYNPIETLTDAVFPILFSG